MTKQASDEVTLKGHIALEEANKASPSITEIVNKNALVIRGAHNPEQKGKPNVTLVTTRKNTVKGKLRKIMPKLYDIENSTEPEKPLNIDLDLYQMENF